MISCFQTSGNGEVGLVYLALSSSPYNVEFMSLDVAPSAGSVLLWFVLAAVTALVAVTLVAFALLRKRPLSKQQLDASLKLLYRLPVVVHLRVMIF
jgi:hypothetical protein